MRARLLEATGGALGNRRARDIESASFLSGFARCAVCGGSLGVTSGSHRSARAHVYGCLAYHKRGTSVCGNALKIPIDRIDQTVLSTLAGDVLRPAVVMAIVDGVLTRLEPRAAARDIGQHRTALQTVEREIGNLTKTVAAGDELEPLLVELRARQARRDELLAAIAAHESVKVLRFDRKAIEQKVRRHIDGWRAAHQALSGGPATAARSARWAAQVHA